MTERLLQYIWQFQHFNKTDMQTEAGEALQVLHAGMANHNQGPDFLAGRIRINDTLWVGNIELHLRTSDWFRHQHQEDDHYKNIILHVVWNNDAPAGTRLSPGIPLIELQARIPVILLERYEQWMNNPSFIPCENNVSAVPELVWEKWKERLVIERLQRKSSLVLERFARSNHHWEETFWWIIARNFGLRVNADAFEEIAQSIPVTVLSKHKFQVSQIEALLFGQAGLLGRKFEEKYPRMLQKEYRHLQKMYQFKKIFVSLKFLRMRPSAFPSVRLAQLAMLVCNSSHLFSTIKETAAISDLRALLQLTANDYWHYHYRFDELTDYSVKNLGSDMINAIIINGIIPLLFAYGTVNSAPLYIDRVLEWMSIIERENNRVTRSWMSCGVKNRHALDSQALLELKSQYCDGKRCLDCAVGNALLNRS